MYTDDLRRALDDRGVAHADDDGDLLRVTSWQGARGRAAFKEWRTGDTRFEARGVDAVAALELTMWEVTDDRD